MGIDSERLETLHRLRWAEHWSVREIARHLHMARRTVQKYLHSPLAPRRRSKRTSKLDPYKETLADLLRQDPTASCVVLRQRIASLGYRGGRSILDEYVRSHRQKLSAPRAFLRIEVEPGERFRGRLGPLRTRSTTRATSASSMRFAWSNATAGMLYLEFTHSQSFETFARCHMHAFHFMGGVAREIWSTTIWRPPSPNMTASLVRFNPALPRLRPRVRLLPAGLPCGAPPGKKAKSNGVASAMSARTSGPCASSPIWTMSTAKRASGWPKLPTSACIGKPARRPDERFQPDALRPLPAVDPDYRDTADGPGSQRSPLCFDGNRYCVPPRYVGRRPHRQSRLQLRHHLRPARPKIVSLSPLVAAWPDLRSRTIRKRTARPAAGRSSVRQRSSGLVALAGSEPAPKSICATWPIPTAHSHAKSRNCSTLIRHYGPEAVAGRHRTAPSRPALSAPITSPISCASNCRPAPATASLAPARSPA